MLRDQSRRLIHYLRVSVTDRCNHRCRYCLPAAGARLLPHEEILRYEEILAFAAVAAREGIDKLRVTGGEPLLRRGIVSFMERLVATPGLDDVSMTTNGTLLPRFAAELRAAGLKRINIGIPGLHPDTYRGLTRGGSLADATAGLESALAAGFSPVKVNVVVLRAISDDPAPYLELTRRLPVQVRFIEYMPIGPVPSEQWFVSAAEFESRLAAYGPFEPAGEAGDGPASAPLRIPGAPGSFARIAAMTEHFCDRCNRLRLTADGRLRLCLFGQQEIDLRSALRPQVDEAALAALLAQAVAAKPQSCLPERGLVGGRRMSQIGG